MLEYYGPNSDLTRWLPEAKVKLAQRLKNWPSNIVCVEFAKQDVVLIDTDRSPQIREWLGLPEPAGESGDSSDGSGDSSSSGDSSGSDSTVGVDVSVGG